MDKTEMQLREGEYREDGQSFKALLDTYIAVIGKIKPFGRTKGYVINSLRYELGHYRLCELTSEVLLDFAQRRRETCCASTVKMDMQYVGVVLDTAENMWGARPKLDEYRKAMGICHKLGIISSSDERDRRCSEAEITAILQQVRSALPVGDWVAFSLCTAMRVGEIANLRWRDLSADGKTIIIRQRKHPKKKRDEVVPLVPEARAIITRQPKLIGNAELIFPHNAKSITSAFRFARQRAGIEDMRYHDLRHEAISRLFDLGFDSMIVASFSGHRDINMLRRYTHTNAGMVLKLLDERTKKLSQDRARDAAFGKLTTG
jgi:integrase